MRISPLSLLACSVLSTLGPGCKKESVPAPTLTAPPDSAGSPKRAARVDPLGSPATGSAGLVQVALGEGEPRRLGFKVTKVYRGHQPADTAPFHTEGGEWTFFDAQLTADPEATFTVGTLEEKSGGPISFGKARLSVPDAKA